MDVQQFLAEFRHIANAPGGVSRLRDLTLFLAMRGKLVDYEDTEENGNDLLAEIAQHKETETRTRFRILEAISKTDEPYSIPKHWAWARLGDLVDLLDSLRQPITKNRRSSGSIPYYGASGIVDYVAEHIFDEDLVLVGEDGAKWARGEATAFRISGKSWVNNHAHVLRPRRSFISDDFLTKALVEMDITGFTTGMTVPKLNQAKLISIPIPLPPPNEQVRIVAKIDELMNLCDQLEQQQQKRRRLQNALRQSTLQAVIEAQSYIELQQSWKRLEDNFDSLLDESKDIEEFRKLSSELAVRGLLTQQHEDDEPSKKLLERIADEQSKMMLNGELKRQKPLPDINLEDAPFALPKGWSWARFPELGSFGRGKSKHRPRNDPKLFNPGIYPLVQTGEVARSSHTIMEYHSKYSEFGLEQSKLWPKGTLCITIAANIADTAILGFDACFPDSVVGFVPSEEIRDEVEYFLLFMRTARSKLLEFAPSTAQKNINLKILESVLIPLPPVSEIRRILEIIRQISALCEKISSDRKNSERTAALFLNSAMSAITGLSLEQEEDTTVKAPKTELVAPLRLCRTPDINAQAPLTTILARHDGELPARDLWQRFGGEIDAFYAQLKNEVAHGWIAEPAVAEMLEKPAEAAGA